MKFIILSVPEFKCRVQGSGVQGKEKYTVHGTQVHGGIVQYFEIGSLRFEIYYFECAGI